MSRLDELVEKLCPDGVELKRIIDVTRGISTGLNPRQHFRLNNYDAKNYYVTVKEFAGGRIKFSEKTDRIDDEAIAVIQQRSKLEINDILLSGIGTIGKVALVDIDTSNWNCSESCILLKPNTEIIDPKFFLYVLRSSDMQARFFANAKGSTLKGIRQQDLKEYEIPVPPLEVQFEVVRILDSLTLYTEELKEKLLEELIIRKKQQEAYRDFLLGLGNEKEKQKCMISDIAEFVTVGIANSATHAYSDDGIVLFRNQNIRENYLDDSDLIYINKEFESRYRNKRLKKHDILVSRTGYPGQACVVPEKYEGSQTFTTLILRLKQHEEVNPYYICHYINSKYGKDYVASMKTGAAQQNFNASALTKMPIVLPKREKQNSVVKMLSCLDELYAKIFEGIQEEVKERQKQYEYYRDKLLTFKEKSC